MESGGYRPTAVLNFSVVAKSEVVKRTSSYRVIPAGIAGIQSQGW